MTVPSFVLLGAEAAQPSLPMWPVFLAIGVMFYLMIIAPERRKRNQHSQMLGSLKINDRVVTIGGILGTVVNTGAEEVTLRVDDALNTKLRVLRSSVSKVIKDESQKPEKTVK